MLLLSLVFLRTSLALQEVNSDSYLNLSAEKKLKRILSNCYEDTTSGHWLNLLQMAGIFITPMCPTFRAQGDEMPYERRLFFSGHRTKFIHRVGSVGQVEWRNRGGHPYTGIFQGSTRGIVRLSLALKPEETKTVPGMGLKFLRDGIDSANLVAMQTVVGQNSWNFFKHDFTTIIPRVKSLKIFPVMLKFSTASQYIWSVSVSDFGRYGESGFQIIDPRFPFMLRFQPTGEFIFSDHYVRPLTQDLETIPVGSTLYKIWALDKPVQLGGEEEHIGDLVLTSKLVPSLWGDKHLFFRHQDMAQDVKVFPQWKKHLRREGLETLLEC